MWIFRFLAVEGLAAAAAVVPVFLVLGRAFGRPKSRTAADLVLALYLTAVFSLTGLPSLLYIRVEPRLQLLPFLGMAEDLRNTVLNLGMFVPLGFLLPLQYREYRSAKRTVLFGFVLSLTIEVLQIFSGRATDVNDLIVNTAGAALGWLLSCPVQPHFRGDGRPGELAVTVTAAFLLRFCVTVFLSEILWQLV